MVGDLKKYSVSNGMIGDDQAIFVKKLRDKGYTYGLIVRLAIATLPTDGFAVGYKHQGYMTKHIADTLVSADEKAKLDEYCTRNGISISQGVRDGLHLLSQNGLVKEDE